MSTALRLVVVVAALACLLHMLWTTRRAGEARCVVTGCGGDSIEGRQDRLAARVQALADERTSRLR